MKLSVTEFVVMCWFMKLSVTEFVMCWFMKLSVAEFVVMCWFMKLSVTEFVVMCWFMKLSVTEFVVMCWFMKLSVTEFVVMCWFMTLSVTEFVVMCWFMKLNVTEFVVDRQQESLRTTTSRMKQKSRNSRSCWYESSSTRLCAVWSWNRMAWPSPTAIGCWNTILSMSKLSSSRARCVWCLELNEKVKAVFLKGKVCLVFRAEWKLVLP